MRKDNNKLLDYDHYVGFNNFMNDSAMMLGRRAFEPYLFVTWCITAPIISLVCSYRDQNNYFSSS